MLCLLYQKYFQTKSLEIHFLGDAKSLQSALRINMKTFLQKDALLLTKERKKFFRVPSSVEMFAFSYYILTSRVKST